MVVRGIVLKAVPGDIRSGTRDYQRAAYVSNVHVTKTKYTCALDVNFSKLPFLVITSSFAAKMEDNIGHLLPR